MPEENTPRMEIAAARRARTSREIKINIPHEMCVRLHSRKILSGITIAETVVAALDSYFAQLQTAREAGGPPGNVEDLAR